MSASNGRLRVSINAEPATLRLREAVNVQFSVQPPALLSCFSIKLVPGLVRWIDATVYRDIQTPMDRRT